MALGVTPHSDENQRFSNLAHLRARDDIYPFAFKVQSNRITYPELKDAKTRDYDMAIDRTLGIQVEGLHAPINFSAQERFRRAKYASHRDVTFTVLNHNSGLLSELHKIEAAMMLYAYFDSEADQFIETILFRVPVFKEYLIQGSLAFESHPNPRSNQTFYSFKFDDLLARPGIVKFHKRWGG